VTHHGLADHADRYAGFAERLVHASYAVWAFDMRGHGRSAGVRVRIDRVDDLLDDPTRSSRWSGAASPGARSCSTATAWVGAATPRPTSLRILATAVRG
jgi:pimeloyl-ACP methyl ester carboxylesterase